MSLFNKSKRHWTSLTQGSSMALLLIIPKCSLCLFTVTNTIAVCGITPMITPLWEYLLVGFFALFQLSITLYEMRKNLKVVPLLISALGLAALSAFLFFKQPDTYYYAGVLLLSSGWIVARIQRVLAGKSHCAEEPDHLTFIPQSQP